MELLDSLKLTPPCSRQVDFVVAAFNKEMQGPSMKVAAKLRELNFSVDLIPDPKKRVASAFDYADRAVSQLR